MLAAEQVMCIMHRERSRARARKVAEVRSLEYMCPSSVSLPRRLDGTPVSGVSLGKDSTYIYVYIYRERKTYQCKLWVLLGPPLKVTFPRFPSYAPSPFDSPVQATAPPRHGLDNDDARPIGKEKAGSIKGLANVEGRERLAPEAEAGPDRGLGKGRRGEYNG